MKEKIIKSKQIGIDCPAIECECGGDCYGTESQQAYTHFEDTSWQCEECYQIWVLPEGVDIVAIFRKIRRPSK